LIITAGARYRHSLTVSHRRTRAGCVFRSLADAMDSDGPVNEPEWRLFSADRANLNFRFLSPAFGMITFSVNRAGCSDLLFTAGLCLDLLFWH
jgi:hypothetical protein